MPLPLFNASRNRSWSICISRTMSNCRSATNCSWRESRVKEQDLAEGSPDHLGESLEAADQGPPRFASGPASGAPIRRSPKPATAWCRQPCASRSPPRRRASGSSPIREIRSRSPQHHASLPASGTVILEVETGGIVVPSFLGKSVRAAVELAEQSGLDMDAVGSGTARQQSPPPGSHVAAGSRVTVNFGR